ncbi:DUF551 domain-containing protein [Citrobacter koseri]|nr:DUF551 domain-containing protein [Citrobacter koseri]
MAPPYRAEDIRSDEFNELRNKVFYALRDAQNDEPVSNRDELPEDVSTVLAEVYQVVGVMAEALGVFDDTTVQKVMDNLSHQKLVHSDVLPFSLPTDNSPVIPDRWIPVSERMPEKGQKVFYYFDIVGVHAGYYDGDNTFVNENGGGWLTGDVTHWMEWNMPAAPQQEVKQALAKGMERYGDSMQELAKKEVK